MFQIFLNFNSGLRGLLGINSLNFLLGMQAFTICYVTDLNHMVFFHLQYDSYHPFCILQRRHKLYLILRKPKNII